MNENKAFLAIHSILLAVVLVGFSRSFYLRNAFFSSALDAPLLIHGTMLTCWYALTVLQAWLALKSKYQWHRKIAWFAGFIAIGVVLSATWINTRLASNLHTPADPENMFIWGNYMSLVFFVGLLAGGVMNRYDPEKHRRLILWASVIIIGPAFARFAFWPIFGGGGVAVAPLFSGGGLLVTMLVLIVYDLAVSRKVTRVTLAGVASVFAAAAVSIGLAVTGIGFQILSFLHVVEPQ